MGFQKEQERANQIKEGPQNELLPLAATLENNSDLAHERLRLVADMIREWK
jgi:hypothetical protein